MEAVVQSEAVSDLKFRLQQCRTNCNLRADPADEGEFSEEVAAATAEAQARMRIENMKIGSGELREQDLWECGDGDQSPLTHLEYEKLYNSGWGTFSVILMGLRHDLDAFYLPNLIAIEMHPKSHISLPHSRLQRALRAWLRAEDVAVDDRLLPGEAGQGEKACDQKSSDP